MSRIDFERAESKSNCGLLKSLACIETKTTKSAKESV